MAGRLSTVAAARTVEQARARRARVVGRGAVIAAVALVHACVVRGIHQSVIDVDPARKPARIELVLGQEMAFSTPVAQAVPAGAVTETPPVPRPARQAKPVAEAASAPAPEELSMPLVDAAASVVLPTTPASAPTPKPLPTPVPPATAATSGPAPLAAAEPPAAVAALADAASAAPAEAFAWPPSTRITYELSGNYRGEVHGSAQVDWVRVGARYQVHLDVLIGPSFAPILTRRMSSDGQLTPGGLVPERYDEDIKAAFRDRKRAHVSFEADAVVLNNGVRAERVPGVQDTASQFVQLTYLITRQPELLKPGTTIEMPLALPRRMSRWLYDVREPEVIATSFGAIEVVALQPRRESRKGDELSATVWLAPSLRYLPVRIRIQQDTETFIDLMIEKRPQIAGP